MRVLATWMVAVGLLAGTAAFAGDGAKKDKAANDTKASAAVTNTADTAKPAETPATPAALESEIRQMRQLLAEQTQQIEAERAALHEQQERMAALEAELRLARTGNPLPAAVTAPVPATSAAPPEPALAVAMAPAPPQDADKKYKDLEERIKKIGPFTWGGDFRLRDEPFIGGPTDSSQVRNRERFRLRINVNAKLNDDLSGGFSTATGDINDPISTNQTTNQFYTRKPFLIDKAFITYHPHQLKALTLTGGKFAYPWYRTELTWDNDLNPEGVAETLDFKTENSFLKDFKLVGFQLPFAEVSGINFSAIKNFIPATTNKSIVQSAVYGGQIGAVWGLGSAVTLSTYGAFYNWHNPDSVALALATAEAASPANGLLKLGGSNPQNSVTTFTVNTPVPTTTANVNTNVNSTIASAMFNSKFGLMDAIAKVDFKTGSDKMPVTFLGDYVQNTRACANVQNVANFNAILAAAVPAGSTLATSTSAACNSRQRRGYWLEGRVGRLQEKNDWQFAYTRMMIEREAVLSAFDFSDMRQSSNVSQHRLEIFYQAYRNIQLQFTGLFGRPLVTATSPAPAQPILKRLQLDVVYKF